MRIRLTVHSEQEVGNAMTEETVALHRVSERRADLVGRTILEDHSHVVLGAEAADEGVAQLVGAEQPRDLRKASPQI